MELKQSSVGESWAMAGWLNSCLHDNAQDAADVGNWTIKLDTSNHAPECVATVKRGE